jgi:hypothetical protein
MNRIPTAELRNDVVWHGHAGDLARLMESAVAHCNCLPVAGPGSASRLCSAHEILTDQHTLDHLAFARSVRARLVDEEWRQSAPSATNLDRAEWLALLSWPPPERRPTPAHTDNVWGKLARSPLLLSLIALLLLFGVGAPGEPVVPPDHPIASWGSR